MMLARSELLCTMLLAPLVSIDTSAGRVSRDIISDDGAFNLRLPPQWQIVSTCWPGQTPCSTIPNRRAVARARRDDGRAWAEATVDLADYGMKLGEFVSLSEAATKLMPPNARLLDASATTSKAGAPKFYVLRYALGGAAPAERVVRLAVQQSRLYTLTLQAEAPVAPEVEGELNAILQSYSAFPVSTLRGGLLSSKAEPLLRPRALEFEKD